MKVGKIIDVRHNSAARGIVFKVEKNPVHLVELALFIFMLYAELITVSLAYGTVFVRPLIPYFRIEVLYIVALFLDRKSVV